MQVMDAYVSGSLGQALFRENGNPRILDGPKSDPRIPAPNEIQWFRHCAREVAFVDVERTSTPIKLVRERLTEEIRFFTALDGLLIGMDSDFSEETRRHSILQSEKILSDDDDLAKRVRRRFLVPCNTQEWDPAKGLSIALDCESNAVADSYRPLVDGVVDRIAGELRSIVHEKLGADYDAAKVLDDILSSGILADLSMSQGYENSSDVANLLFRSDEFPGLLSANQTRQVLVGLHQRIGVREGKIRQDPPGDIDPAADERQIDADVPDAGDPILEAAEQAFAAINKRGPRKQSGNHAELENVQSQVLWIEQRLQAGEKMRGEQALIKLIKQQGQRGRAEDLVKTLTAFADSARKTMFLDLAERVLRAIAISGRDDSHSLNVRAETLRDLGHYDEALEAFKDTMERFPHDEVAPTARAETLRDLGDYEEALKAFEETIVQFPDNEVARNARAETLRDLGRYDEALEAFEETMECFPHDKVARTARAETLRDLGDYEEALKAFEETIVQFPDNEVARTARAETLRDLGDYEEALKAFEETIVQFPDNEVARNARAETLRDLGDYEEALKAFKETMERFPHNVVAWTARAETLRDLGDYEKALKAFEGTMERFPHNVVARNARAETLRDLGDYEEALKAFEETMERFPHDKVARNARAETLRDLGRYDEALEAFEETMECFPHDKVARTARAETLRDLGDYEEALKAFEETMERFPHDEVARTARAETLRDLGDYEEALKAFEETMERFPHDEVARTARAETLRDLGDYEEALKAFEETMERFPHNVVARTARAETLRDLGDYEEALKAFEETMERFPHDVVARTARAKTLRDLGDYEEALKAFEETMERFPHDVVARTARAETLRDLGDYEKALKAFEETMKRFPHDEVARNARAETLRDLRRYDEALEAFKDTMERFPRNEVARRACAHLLVGQRRFGEAKDLLASAANRDKRRTRGDWIAAHILAMSHLREGGIEDALSDFDYGVESCPFPDVRRYFKTARPLALLALKRAGEAAQQWKTLAEGSQLSRYETTNIILLQAHALSAAGEQQQAKKLIECPQVVEFSVAKQKLLAQVLFEQYISPTGDTLHSKTDDESIFDLEFELIRPELQIAA